MKYIIPLATSLLLLTFIFSLVHAQTIDLSSGLVSWWEMEEATGTRYDSHGIVHLTDNNTVQVALGIINNGSYMIRANNEYLTVVADSLSSGGNDFTIAGYTKIFTNGVNSYLGRRRLGGIPEYEIYFTTINRLFLRIYDNDSSSIKSTWADCGGGAPVDIFFAAWMISKTLNVFCNGSAATPVSIVDPYYANSLTNEFGSAGSDFILDEWAFWNRALSADEISYLYNGGSWRAYDEIVTPASQYTLALPSGGTGEFTMSATAGELAITVSVIVLASILLFDVLRQIAHLTAKK